MKNKNNYSSFIVLNVLIFVCFLELVFPPVTVFGNEVFIRTLCLALWFIFSFMSDSDFYFNLKIQRSFLLIFCAATVVFPYLIGYSTFGNRYMDIILVPFGLIVFDYYKCHGKLGDLKNIILIIMAFATVTMLITITKLAEDSYISRTIRNSTERYESLSRQGVGGYHFIYFMVPIGIMALYIFLRSRNKYIKIFSMVYYFATFYLIFRSSYTTALLTYIIASAVLIINYFSQKEGQNKALLWISVLTVVVLLLNLNTIVFALEDLLPQRIAQAIVPEENESVLTAVYNEFIIDRWPTIVSSFRQTLASPVLGALISGGEVTSVLNSTGQHSHIMDTFAFFGIRIGVVNIFVCLAPFKDMAGNWIRRGKALNIAMLVCMIGIYFFNNATSNIALALGIIYPLVRENFDMENQNEKNNRINRMSVIQVEEGV